MSHGESAPLRLRWLFSAAVAFGAVVFAWSTLGGVDPSTPPAEAHDAAAGAAMEPLDCDEGDTGTMGHFDYQLLDPRAGAREPRSAVSEQLFDRGRFRGVRLDEFVAGETTADRATQRLVRDGRVLAVASLRKEPGGGWFVTSLGACLGVLAQDGAQ